MRPVYEREEAVVIGLLVSAALLLVVAGAPKVWSPGPTRTALTAARLPGGRWTRSTPAARASGAVEVVVGLSALLVGGPVAAGIVALTYLVLAVVAARMLAVAPASSCGCFAGATEPASRAHVAVNLVLAAVASAAAVVGTPSAVSVVTGGGPVTGGVLLVLAALLAWLVYLLMTALPPLLRISVPAEASR